MRNAPLLKQIKKIPYLFLAMVMVLLVLSIIRCLDTIGTTELINVNIKDFKTKTYKRVDVGENIFSMDLKVGYTGR